MTEKNYATAPTLFLLNVMIYLPHGRLAFLFVSFRSQSSFTVAGRSSFHLWDVLLKRVFGCFKNYSSISRKYEN